MSNSVILNQTFTYYNVHGFGADVEIAGYDPGGKIRVLFGLEKYAVWTAGGSMVWAGRFSEPEYVPVCLWLVGLGEQVGPNRFRATLLMECEPGSRWHRARRLFIEEAKRCELNGKR